MKKYLLFIFMLLIIPFSVFAEECDDSKVIIKDIVLKQSIGNTEEIETATLENSIINLNVKMYEVGDSISYTFKVKNESNEDYFIDDKIILNHIEYVVNSADSSNKVAIGEEKEFVLVATLKDELTKEDFRGGKFDASTTVNLSVVPESLYNPSTGDFFIRIMLLLIFIICMMIFVKNKTIRVSAMVLALIFIPYTSHAACKINFEINSNVVVGYVTPNPCVYDGNLVQGAELVNGQYTYRYKQEYGYDSGFTWVNMDIDGWGVTLTDKNSTSPVTTTLCTSINGKPIVSMSHMFYLSQTTSIDTSSFDTSHVTSMHGMFCWANRLTTLDCSTFDTSNVTSMTAMFNGASALTSVNLDGFDTSKVKTMNTFFFNNSALTSVDVSSFDTSSVTDMGAMFYGLSSVKSLDLSNFNTSNVTDMSSLLGGMSSLVSLNLSGFDFSKYTASGLMMSLTAGGLSSLKTLNFSNVKFSQCSYAFGGLPSVTEIKLDGADTSNVTDMNSMFYGDSGLTSLDLSSFDTYNVTNMPYMFEGCTNITTIDVSSFDTYKVTNMEKMFYNLGNLRTIYGSVWFNASNASSSSNMFYGCYNLVGGQGSPYNSLYIDRLSARLDEPNEGRPGYFTAKATS